jgi:uncharacterized damage-inducible protein DinB
MSRMEHTTQRTTSAPALTPSRAQASPGAEPDVTDRAPEPMLTLMRYKRWADAALLEAALALPADFPALEAGYITAIIRHYHTVDRIFRAHLLGISHGFTSPNPAEPATLSELQQRVLETDEWYVDYASKLHERDLAEGLQVTFTDGQQQALRRSDILHYVSLHGGGHRAQVALFMKLRGVDPPPDRLINFLRS